MKKFLKNNWLLIIPSLVVLLAIINTIHEISMGYYINNTVIFEIILLIGAIITSGVGKSRKLPVLRWIAVLLTVIAAWVLVNDLIGGDFLFKLLCLIPYVMIVLHALWGIGLKRFILRLHALWGNVVKRFNLRLPVHLGTGFKKINHWVFGNTGRFIKNMVKGAFWLEVLCVLICAIYFSIEDSRYGTTFNFLLFLAICLGGWAVAMVESVMLHSWGDLVENSRLIAQQGVSAKAEPAAAVVSASATVPAADTMKENEVVTEEQSDQRRRRSSL